MTTARYLVGDVFDRMAEIPDGSIDLVMTSPPFLALRSYLPADHADKAKEIGSEATPAEFLDTMLALTAEWGRVLAPHGSICVELGDTYAGSGGAGGDYNEDGLRAGQDRFDGSQRRTRTNNLYNTSNRYSDDWNIGNTAGKPIEGVPMTGGQGWPLPKSLCGIPTLYAWSLAYGRNLLTGEPSPAGRWRVRNLVAWVRPNPPVGALGDKYRPATSYLTIACRARDRYFDLDAVRTPGRQDVGSFPGRETYPGETGPRSNGKTAISGTNPAGAPPLDWWNIPPTGYPGAHYAVYPPELCTRPILTMTPRRVCTTCGKPSRRIVGEAEYVPSSNPTTKASRAAGTAREWDSGIVDGKAAHSHKTDGGMVRTAETVGWSDCGHNTWRPGHVLDPFAGTGTTLAVATGHGREATGIDIDPRNAEHAQQRVGMFLTVDHGTRQETA